MTKTREVLASAAALLICVAAGGAAAQIPSAVEFRVPKSPTVATSDSGSFVAYELHVTNLSAGALTLRRVEVLDADKTGAVVGSMSDSALLRSVGRPTQITPAQRLQHAAGTPA